MCKANDRYWEREIGKEVICKCGKTHYKERRPKPKTCKQCLAEDNLKQLLIDADKAKRKVFRLIGVWQCTSCEIVKPDAISIDYNINPKELLKNIKIFKFSDFHISINLLEQVARIVDKARWLVNPLYPQTRSWAKAFVSRRGNFHQG